MKRRILCFVLTMAMVLSMLVVVPAVTVSADTYSASDNPVIITTDADMAAFQSAVNGGNSFSGKTVKLAGDVALSGALGATSSKPFSGNFDGQNHTVTITQSISNSDGSGGLFSFVRTPASGTCTIQNVKVAGTITLTGTNAGCVGGVVSCVDANTSGSGGTVNFYNVWSDVNIVCQTAGTNDRIGGILGFTRHATDVKNITVNIDSCVYSGTLTSNGKSVNIGGIFGGTGNNPSNRNVNLTISNTLLSGNVIIPYNSKADDCAGFIGYPRGNVGTGTVNATVKDCIASGTISFTGDWSGQENKADFGVALSEATGNYAHGYVTNFYYVQNIFYGSTYVPTIGSSNASKTTKSNADNALTLDEIKALTASDVTMTDTSKWYFGTSDELATPTSIYDSFGVVVSEEPEPGIFDDFSQKEFVITNDVEMEEFANLVTAGTDFAGKTIKLGADVALNGRIGAISAKPFSGNFDGQGHTVTITQSFTNSDAGAGLFSFIRVPADGSVTVENVHVTGTVSSTVNTDNYYGYFGGLIGAVDAGKSGNGGELNVTNCWVTTRLNLNNTRHWAIGGLIGFTRHEDNLKPLTINIDSCLWDGVINSAPAISYGGGLIGYTGNNKAGRTLTINISKTVVAGTIMTNQTWDEVGMVIGYPGGANSDNATAKPTINVTDVVSVGKITYASNNTKELCGFFGKIDGTTELNLTNFYYKPYTIKRAEPITAPLIGVGEANTSTNVEEKTQAELLALSTSAFSDPTKWVDQSDEYYPCPAGIVNVFGSVPNTLYVEGTDINIGTDEAMASFAAAVNSGKTYEGKTVKLTADVNLNGRIGATSSKAFSGNFDGQGHTVTITQSLTNPDGNGGLFDFVRTPASGTVTIQNVHVTGTITVTVTSG
ncbi:MAG: hypothetical protein E7680_02325, partial [Ruminococcaceae bacterium]|nr:hypothetical protein [Oscillospiraceae bacterium]